MDKNISELLEKVRTAIGTLKNRNLSADEVRFLELLLAVEDNLSNPKNKKVNWALIIQLVNFFKDLF